MHMQPLVMQNKEGILKVLKQWFANRQQMNRVGYGTCYVTHFLTCCGRFMGHDPSNRYEYGEKPTGDYKESVFFAF